jgi:mono/diheme cytochrome c family protein
VIRKILVVLVLLAIVAGGAFWLLTAPRTLGEGDLPQHTPDLVNGEAMFYAGGCESCHAAAGATGEEIFKLGGGVKLATPFGTFVAPNISPDPEHGIGGWTTLDFVNAMKFGIDDEGRHLFPAFPYTSYQRMRIEDIIDLKAFLDTLPKVAATAPEHELPFPFNFRRGLGLWQLLYVDGKTFAPNPEAGEAVNRGAYLVTGPGHCGECHTPRNLIGGPMTGRALGGGPAPEGTGRIPNITPDESGIGSWSVGDIVNAFQTGFTPEFDSLGGTMAPVQRNLAHLTEADLTAMAEYLKTVPPVKSRKAN